MKPMVGELLSNRIYSEYSSQTRRPDVTISSNWMYVYIYIYSYKRFVEVVCSDEFNR